MKKTRRTLCILLSLALCAALIVTACSEGIWASLFNAGCDLLFDTDNVTLSLDAEFCYREKLFKTLSGQYIQDGSNSLMNILLKTPREDGSIYEGGYTVIANDGIAYSIETARPQYYTSRTTSDSSSVLTSTVMRRSIREFGTLLLDLADGMLSDHITTEKTADGTLCTLSFTEENTPELVNALLCVAAQLTAGEYFGVNYNQPAIVSSGVSVEIDNWNELFARLYREEYGAPMPDDFFDTLWGTEGSTNEEPFARYIAISDRIYLMTQELVNQYSSGICLMHADGSYDYFSTRDEYIIACGEQYALYVDEAATFLTWYQQQTGQTLSLKEYNAILASNNTELVDAFDAMRLTMYEYYLAIAQQNDGYSAICIYADGSWAPVRSIDAYYEQLYMSFSGATVTDQILQNMFSLDLTDTSVTVSLDDQGRITSASGVVRMLVGDAGGNQSPLEISFSASASAYGESHVDAFDPAAYGVVSHAEYLDHYSDYASLAQVQTGSEEEDYALPDTITFNGIKYQVLLKNDSI